MKYERVKVRRDTQTTHNKAVAPWEIPVLEYVFEDGNVEQLNEFVDVPHADYPDPLAEFQRLQSVYGVDPETKTHFVALVYGNSGAGVRALKKAIDSAQETENEAKPKQGNSGRRRASQAEALLG